MSETEEMNNAENSSGFDKNELAIDNAVEMRSIIGSDNRAKVTNVTSNPYLKIAALVTTWPDGTVSRGTGFMISNKYMLTAAHVVYNIKKGTAAQTVHV